MSNLFDEGQTAGGKYFQVRVPDFAKAAPTQTKRDAYLRIGGVAPSEETARSEELWNQFVGYAADEGIEWHLRDAKGEDVARPVRYDRHGRLAGVAALLTREERLALRRKVLLEETGWRDHCDGNRITTTSGDKVEIVGGNYQLVVLGRAADQSGSSSDDHSGGQHIDGTVSPPQTVTQIRYQSSFDGGSWSMVEESRKASVQEIFTGEYREDFCGPRHTSIVGVLDATVLTELALSGVSGGGLRGAAELEGVASSGADAPLLTAKADVNPDMLQVTLAEKITEYTGALSKPVTAITRKTFAATLSDEQTATVSYSEALQAGQITATIAALGTWSEVQTFSTHHESVTGNFAFRTEHLATRMTLENIGSELKLSNVGADLTMQVGKHAELFIGVHSEVTVGRRNEIVAGSEVEFTAAEHLKTATLLNTVGVTIRNSALAILLG